MEIRNKLVDQITERTSEAWETVRPYYEISVTALLQLPDRTEAALQKLFEVTLPLFIQPAVDPLVSRVDAIIDQASEKVDHFIQVSLPDWLNNKSE